jgi:hypothetical protein
MRARQAVYRPLAAVMQASGIVQPLGSAPAAMSWE